MNLELSKPIHFSAAKDYRKTTLPNERRKLWKQLSRQKPDKLEYNKNFSLIDPSKADKNLIRCCSNRDAIQNMQ